MRLFTKKPLQATLADGNWDNYRLKKTLSTLSLVALCLGAISGSGLFMRTSSAIVFHAGPSVILAFVIAAVACTLAGMCYAELASMIPIAGSAYTYSFAALGEGMAWVIGWDLILEYGVGAAAISIGWSEYLNHSLGYIGLKIPYELCHSPFQVDPVSKSRGILNLPSVAIVVLVTIILVKGTKESAQTVGVLAFTKLIAILAFIILGFEYIDLSRLQPFIPRPSTVINSQGIETNFGGLKGIIGAAGIVFFTFLGFDVVATAAQEAKNPSKSIPRAIMISLGICTLLFTLFSFVFVGVSDLEDLKNQGNEASITYALEHMSKGPIKHKALSIFMTLAILMGFSSAVLVMLLGQSRIVFSMSRDGLLPEIFSKVNPKYRTPANAHAVILVLCSLLSGFVPIDILGEVTSIGTLFSFILVFASVWILRPKWSAPPKFKVPHLPVVASTGIFLCVAMIYGLGWTNWIRLLIWLLLGFVIYFCYSRHRSKFRY